MMKELNQEIKEHLLKTCVGIKNAISMESLAFTFNTNTRQIRIEIELLRQQVPLGEDKYFLVSHNEGYWLTKDTKEASQWLNRYLGQAAKQFKNARQTIKQLNREEQAKIQKQFEFDIDETELQAKYKHAIIKAGNKTEKK